MKNKDSFALFKKNLAEFPRQLSYPLKVEGKAKKPRTKIIYICGMGGSGIAGDIVKSLISSTFLEIRTWKNYGLPPEKNAVYLFISFSGNTEETLSGIKEALKKNPSRIIGVATSGGELKKIAEIKDLKRVIIPDNLTPREAVGYNTHAVFLLLHASFPHLKEPRVSLNSISLEVTGKKIARNILGKIPLIYVEEEDKTIGYAWKMYLNETGKIPCFTNIIPEMNHNEIQSFEKNKFPFFAVFLTGNPPTGGLRPRITKRIKICAEILKERGIQNMTIALPGKIGAERIWNGVLLGAWTAFSLAERKCMDPTKTPAIETLKKRIAR